MIAPDTIEALGEIARALGFDLVLVPAASLLEVGTTYRLTPLDSYGRPAGDPKFEGTSRECAAYLIGFRDLRSRMLAELGASDRAASELHGIDWCSAYDTSGRRCIRRTGHEGEHTNLKTWSDLR